MIFIRMYKFYVDILFIFIYRNILIQSIQFNPISSLILFKRKCSPRVTLGALLFPPSPSQGSPNPTKGGGLWNSSQFRGNGREGEFPPWRGAQAWRIQQEGSSWRIQQEGNSPDGTRFSLAHPWIRDRSPDINSDETTKLFNLVLAELSFTQGSVAFSSPLEIPSFP